jgi:predicted RNA binding protein YcfA (HicA-like mRNA interferase family)
MVKNSITIRVPNPHQKDIGKELLSRILRQAGIDKKEWEKL